MEGGLGLLHIKGQADHEPSDSYHSRVIRNQQNLYPNFPPTAVVKLLQYNGLGSNTGMSFLRTNDLSEVKNGEFGLDFKAW